VFRVRVKGIRVRVTWIRAKVRVKKLRISHNAEVRVTINTNDST
jgi:hypothetical protein